MAILKSYSARVKWVSEKDRGQTHAINKGMTQARGTVRAYLNSDDLLRPGAVSRVVEHFREHPGCDLVYGRDALIDAERAEFEHRFAEEMESAARTLDLTGVLRVLSTYRKIAEITQRQGEAAHRRMLEQAAGLQRGDDVPTVPGHVHKAEINARLGI